MINGTQVNNFDPRVVHEAFLQRKEDDAIRCLTCFHKCLIHENKQGICGTRVNVNGTLKTLVYGNVSSINNNLIEKKPFFHFAPGTKALTVGSWGCNASCPFCQNFDISKQKPTPQLTKYMSPSEFVELAQEKGSEGLSISFSEAATLMLEWNLAVFRIAKGRGLYNTIVTNGYMTPEALDLMIDAGLDAANVDVKGCEPQVSRTCGISLQPVLDNVLHMREEGVHVELTTLVVPKLSDNMECLESIASWIVENTGPKTPWHLNRYYPACEYTESSTPIELLLEARDMARRIGLEFVYIGNVGTKGLEDTICPNCGSLCYERLRLSSRNVATDTNGKCKKCGYNLNVTSWDWWTTKLGTPSR
ncbi:MAG: AmmeMemoRadiSam system radical SAM enzyme [Candidatus Thorarchaeota archaeon]|nr:AmmeMemoRadiSam system radical SAM enzyme [Candidatus Thorarchaeota archaeon]